MSFFIYCLSLFIFSNTLCASLASWIILCLSDIFEVLLSEIMSNYLVLWCCSDVCNWYTIIFCHLTWVQTELNISLITLMILWILAWNSCLYILRFSEVNLHSYYTMTFMWVSSQIEMLFHDLKIYALINISLIDLWSCMPH